MGKPQNRHELRRQYDAAEPLDPMEDESDDIIEESEDEGERRPRKKAKPAKAKAPKAPKAAKPAARMRIVWAVVNDAFKTVQTFDYTKKEEAETYCAAQNAKNKGTYFVQRIKEPMPDNAPGLGAIIPRPIPEPLAEPKAADLPEEEEEEDDEEEDDFEDEDDYDEE